jgi:hypothetical protein
MRSQWKRAHRETRLMGSADIGSNRHFGVIMAAVGARSVWDGKRGTIAQRIFSLMQANVRTESARYERTRTVLNSFGRLNPWNSRYRSCGATYRDANRVRALRRRLLERRLIAPEPGGYVTGLLSVAPAKMWWEDYGRPVAAMSRDDLELFNGREAA